LAARRNKSQARRNDRNGLPGWAWLVLGLLLGIGLILAAPRLLQSDGGDGFFRPRPNPDAQPASTAGEDDEPIVPDSVPAPAPAAATAAKPKEPTYDFYTMLPGDEVALSDAELAASAKAEAARAAQAAAAGDKPARDDEAPDAADEAERPAAPAQADEVRYILQAGAFAASGDAEAVKARIALLGLGARVESAQIDGKTVYRVRMGPYGSASELAEAKRKLAGGGLPAMAIRAK